MREIESLLTEAAKIANELKRLDQMEEEARAAIVDATDSDVTLPSTQQKIGEARLSLQVVAARRSKVKPPFSLLYKRLLEQFKAEGTRWNAIVEAERLAKEKEIVAVQLQYWGGDEKCMRRTMGASLFAPTVFQKYRQATFIFPYYQYPEEQDLVRDVRLMIAHIERSKDALGLS